MLLKCCLLHIEIVVPWHDVFCMLVTISPSRSVHVLKKIFKKDLRKPLQVAHIQIMYLNLSDIFVLRLVQVQGRNQTFFRSGFFSCKKSTLSNISSITR